MRPLSWDPATLCRRCFRKPIGLPFVTLPQDTGDTMGEFWGRVVHVE
jgi:hypothetical protein